MTHELYKRYRPKKLEHMIGQANAVAMLSGMLQRKTVPHALLLSGPSGVGKTTLARILKKELGCSNSDFHEINAAKERGLDTVREIAMQVGLAPMNGRCRIYLIDECHQLTRKSGGDAQTALLKLLEDTPAHVYFFLATTDPTGLLPTIRNRCTQIKLGLLDSEDLEELIGDVLERESRSLDQSVTEKIVEAADGSARKALVLLESVLGLSTKQEQLDAIQPEKAKKQSIDLARAFLDGRKWPEVAGMLKDTTEDPESLRQLILAYSTSVLLGGGAKAERAYRLIVSFEGSFFASGKAGLSRACYETFSHKT